MRAWVTGASSGLGKALALAFLELGYQVEGISRTHTLEHTNYRRHCVDLSKAFTLPKLATPDILVLNAGHGLFGQVETLADLDITQTVTLNLVAPMLIAKQAIPLMKRAHKGDILVIGSESSFKTNKEGSVYAATKFGLRGFTKAIRQECRSKGIRVLEIHPGMLDTPFFQNLHFKPEQGLPLQDVVKMILTALQMPRATHIEELHIQPNNQKIIR